MKKAVCQLVILGGIPFLLSAASNYSDQSQLGNDKKRSAGPLYQIGGQKMSPMDSRILQEIRFHYQDRDLPNEDAIQISVENGRVILEGAVNENEEKSAAEKLAYEVEGVKNVVNRISVKVILDDPESQEWQHLQKRQQLHMEHNLNKVAVQGRARNVAQIDPPRTRKNTVESDRILEGKVKEKLSRKGLSQKFENIEIVVRDGIVTLFGDVKSAQDRLEAEKRANEVTKHVVNNIQVIDVEETKELKPESRSEPEL